MKKIIYINKEVQIGDMVAYNGVSIEVTDKSVEANPDIFKVVDKLPSYFKCVKELEGYIKGRIYEIDDHYYYEEPIVLISERGSHYHTYVNVCAYSDSDCFELTTKEEWNKQKLLDEAKRRYPIGTVLKDVFGNIFTVSKNSSYTIGEHDSILIDNTYVYRDGRWAKVLPLKFITEDGVDIYGDMRTYMVYSDLTMSNGSMNNEGTNSTIKYFYHKENALAYIEKHKEKTLDDYENILFKRGSSTICSSGVVYLSVYGWLKDNEPKLYYTKILQLIADDLNDGRYIHERNRASFHINKEGRVTLHMGDDEGAVYFKLRELAEKARDILGDKMKYLFN